MGAPIPRTFREHCKQNKGKNGRRLLYKVRLLARAARLSDGRVPCVWCGRGLYDDEVTLEHLVPVWMGGTMALVNLALACVECNRKRGACPCGPWQWIGKRRGISWTPAGM